MNGTPLDIIPLWAMLVIVIVASWLVLEVGYRLGQWRHRHVSEEKESPVGAMVAAIMGLLAFVLAFTFGLAASRFESRRQIVLEESNAIGTAFLRTSMLPEPQRSEAAASLRKYADVRISGLQSGKLDEAIAESEKLQEQLWTLATAAGEKDSHAITTGLFIQALNDVIDLHAKRLMVGMRSRIPLIIWFGLFGLAMLGMASMGYQAGLSATRRSPAMFLLVFAFGGVLLLIVDLDRTQEGFLRVSQQSMLDLHKMIHSMQPPQP